MPAVAVIQRPQALSGFIGRKELRRRFDRSCLKSYGSTIDLDKISSDWRKREDIGTNSGAVKCVDIIGNTKGVGRYLSFS